MSELPPLLLPRSPAAVAGLAAALVNALMRVAIVPVFVTPLIDGVVNRGQLDSLAPLLAIAAALVIIGSLALWAQDALLARAGAGVAMTWREQLFRRLLAREPGTLPGTSGGLASRIVHDLREVEVYYQFGLGTLVAESATVLAVVAFLAASNLQATVLLVVLFLPTVVILRVVGKRLERMAERSQEGTEELGAHLQEGFRHHEVVRAFGSVDFILERFRPTNDKTFQAMTRRGVIAGAQIPITQVLAFAAVGALVAVLVTSAVGGAMTTGQIVSYITLVALLSPPAQLLPRGVAMAQQANAAAARLRQLAKSHQQHSATGQHHCDRREPWLELTDLSAGYEGGERLLSDVALSFAGPNLVVLVGASGSGKSTLLRVLLRFLQPASGSVILHGLDLREWPEPELRSTVGYVPQGHDLLRGTIRENLALGRPIGDREIGKALEDVGMAATVEGFADGLDHLLAEDGSGLSGGQQQRLAIARALLSDPSVLLLDEPTSNLDGPAEAELVKVLCSQAHQRLVIAVTHRPALAMAADQLLQLSDGRIVSVERRSVQ